MLSQTKALCGFALGVLRSGDAGSRMYEYQKDKHELRKH